MGSGTFGADKEGNLLSGFDAALIALVRVSPIAVTAATTLLGIN